MDEIKTGNFKPKFSFKIIRRKTLIYIAILAVIVIAVLTLVLVSNKSKNQTAVCSQESNLPLMNRAAEAINSTSFISLSDIAKSVSNLPNYQNDPNCLYVMFRSDLQSGDTSKAQTYLATLEKIDPSNDYLSFFNKPTIQSMKLSLNNTEAAINNAANSTIYLSNPKYVKK